MYNRFQNIKYIKINVIKYFQDFKTESQNNANNFQKI